LKLSTLTLIIIAVTPGKQKVFENLLPCAMERKVIFSLFRRNADDTLLLFPCHTSGCYPMRSGGRLKPPADSIP